MIAAPGHRPSPDEAGPLRLPSAQSLGWPHGTGAASIGRSISAVPGV